MIYFPEPPCLDKTKPLSIGQVIASQVGMPPANPVNSSLAYSQAKSVIPKSVVPNPYVLSAQAAYQDMKMAQAKQQSGARNILLSWFGVD